jgi:hypothetical protein
MNGRTPEWVIKWDFRLKRLLKVLPQPWYGQLKMMSSESWLVLVAEMISCSWETGEDVDRVETEEDIDEAGDWFGDHCFEKLVL